MKRWNFRHVILPRIWMAWKPFLDKGHQFDVWKLIIGVRWPLFAISEDRYSSQRNLPIWFGPIPKYISSLGLCMKCYMKKIGSEN